MAEESQDIQKPQQAVPAEVERPEARRTVPPDVDILETPEGTVLVADVPGCDESSVSVHVENNVLTLTARRTPQDVPDHELTFQEAEEGASFERAFSLSETVDTAKIEATVKDGVLRLTLPKAQAARPRKIQVKTG